MSEIKLLPCPFCGGEAKMATIFDEWDGRLYNAVFAFCPVCGCKSEDIEYKYNDLEDAAQKVIKAWNTRKPVEDVLERMEELRKINYDAWENTEWVPDKTAYINMANAYANAIKIIKEVLMLEVEE